MLKKRAGHVASQHWPHLSRTRHAFTTFTSLLSTSISSSAMSNQPNDHFPKSLWSPNKAAARLWSPEPQLANLNSTSANLRLSSALPTLRNPSSADGVVDAGPTIASEIPDNPAAHQVTISYDQVKHHTKDTVDCSQSGPRSPKI